MVTTITGNFIPRLAATLLLVSATFAQAQQQRATVSATISPRIFSPGEQAIYSISVSNATSIGRPPQIPTPPGVRIQYAGDTREQSIVNRVISNRNIMNYALSASVEGNYEVPATTIEVDGEMIAVGAVRFTVKAGVDPAAAYTPFARLSVGKRRLYQGEVTTLEYSLFIHSNTNLQQLPFPDLSNPNLVVKRPDNPEKQLSTVDGQSYTVFTYRTSVQALQAGTVDLAPDATDVRVSIPDRNRRNSLFSRQAPRTFPVKAAPVSMEVVSLPTEGRPDSFTGAVGDFRLEVSANPTALNVGDPISLSSTITGQGNFDTLVAPTISDPNGWRSYPPTTAREYRGSGLTPGSVSYSQVIIPEEQLDAIPAIEFSYFDVGEEKYIVRTIPPIPLTLRPDPGAAKPVAATTYAESDTSVPPPSADLEDVLDILPDSGSLASVRTPAFTGPGFWAAQAFPAVTLLAFLGIGLARKAKDARTVSGPERARTPEDALAELKIADDKDVARLVSEIATRRNLSPAPESELAGLIKQSSTYAYSPENSPAPDRETAIRLLDAKS